MGKTRIESCKIQIICSLAFFIVSCSTQVMTDEMNENCDIKSGTILITEISLNTDENQFWVELYNQSNQIVQLNRAFISMHEQVFPVREAIQIEPESWFVIGNKNTIGADYSVHHFKPGDKTGTLTLQCKDVLVDSVDFDITGLTNASIALDQYYLDDISVGTEAKSWCIDTQKSPGRKNPYCGFHTCLDSDNDTPRLTNHSGIGDIHINEVFTNPLNDLDNKQWIELSLNPMIDLDLNGLILEQLDDNNHAIRWQFASNHCLSVDSSYPYAIIDNESESLPGRMSLPGPSLKNSNSVLRLLINELELDRVKMPHLNTLSTAIRGNGSNIYNLFTCIPDNSTSDAGQIGTPGSINPECLQECLDNGLLRPVQSAQPGELILNELFALPVNSESRWLEIHNISDHAIDINGLSIEQRNRKGNKKAWTVESEECITADAGSYSVISEFSQSEYGFLPIYQFPILDLATGVESEFALLTADIIDIAHLPLASLGLSLQLSADVSDPHLQNDDMENWCQPGQNQIASPNEINATCF